MPKVSPLQGNFASGEFSPLLFGRVDSDRYKTGLATCLNYIPTLQGGLSRRSGTEFVSEVKTSSTATRLVPFEFSTTQAYIIEFGNLYVRFYKDNALITLATTTITGATAANPVVITSNAHGYSNGDRVVIQSVSGMVQLNNREFTVANVAANTYELSGINGTTYTAYTSGGTAGKVYEVVTTYTDSELFQLKFTQSADTLYIVHPLHAPAKLTRSSHTSWSLSTITFLDGPYLPINSTTTTFTPAATTGAGVNVTSSANMFTLFDVGRFIRIKHGSTWGYAVITSVSSLTVAVVTIINAFGNTTAVTTWRLGVWCPLTGYPGSVVFHEDRLCFSGATSVPQRVDGSKSGDYENMAPTDTAGVVANDNAISFTMNANDVNVVRWVTSDEKGLLAGSVGGEWAIKPSTQGEALTPTNITAKRASSYGSANIQPVQAGKATIFVQRSGRKMREMTYFYEVDGFRSPDVSLLSEHVLNGGLVELAFQKEPQPIIWGVRADGVLVSMTYERESESLKVGWARHILGGVGTSAGGDPVVESVAVIPSADGSRQDVWLVVKRYINGATKRYVEYITKAFEDEDEQRDAWFVDCGLSYDAPKTITGATKANPVVVTCNSHGYSNGNTVNISGVLGMTELNGNNYVIANVAANTFELSGINGTAYTTYISAGEARKQVSTVSGLWHLEGETVSVLADGAVQPDVTVSLGVATLTANASTVQVGYNYDSDGQLLRIEAGSQDGTALGKTRRAHRVGMLVDRLLGLKVGMDFDNLTQLTFRTSSDPLTRAPSLFSGILSETIDSDYDFENQFCWRQDQPLPGTILAIMPQMLTQDRG